MTTKNYQSFSTNPYTEKSIFQLQFLREELLKCLDYSRSFLQLKVRMKLELIEEALWEKRVSNDKIVSDLACARPEGDLACALAMRSTRGSRPEGDLVCALAMRSTRGSRPEGDLACARPEGDLQ